MKITNELREKLLTAKSAEEAAELLKADGQEVGPDDVEKLWAEITKHREQEGKEPTREELRADAAGPPRNRD